MATSFKANKMSSGCWISSIPIGSYVSMPSMLAQVKPCETMYGAKVVFASFVDESISGYGAPLGSGSASRTG